MDSDRVLEVLGALNNMTGKWGRKDYFKRLRLRLMYGVEEELLEIVQLKGIGKIKAKRLWDANLRSWEQIAGNTLGVIKALNCSKKVAEDVVENARELIKTGVR